MSMKAKLGQSQQQAKTFVPPTPSNQSTSPAQPQAPATPSK